MLAWWLAAGCSCGDGGGRQEPRPSGSETAHTAASETAGHTGSTPTEPLSWLMLDSGYRHSCGLLSDLRLVCWGETDRTTVIPVGPFTQVSLQSSTGCALTPEGAVECWCAFSSDRYVCDGAPSGVTGFVAVEDGQYAACAERPDHTLHCWGFPSQVRGVPTLPVVDWSMGANAGCAVLEDGSVSCWGDTEVFALSPDAVLGPPDHLKYRQVAVGIDQACAIDTAGEAWCWGSTQFREPFPRPTPGPWVSLTAQGGLVCGLDPEGRAECWHDLPILEKWVVPDERFRQLSLGEWTACGVALDGRGVCFPGPYEQAGDQQVPDLADLALP